MGTPACRACVVIQRRFVVGRSYVGAFEAIDGPAQSPDDVGGASTLDLARGTRCRGMMIASTTEYWGQIRLFSQKRIFLHTTIAGGQRVDRG